MAVDRGKRRVENGPPRYRSGSETGNRHPSTPLRMQQVIEFGKRFEIAAVLFGVDELRTSEILKD